MSKAAPSASTDLSANLTKAEQTARDEYSGDVESAYAHQPQAALTIQYSSRVCTIYSPVVVASTESDVMEQADSVPADEDVSADASASDLIRAKTERTED